MRNVLKEYRIQWGYVLPLLFIVFSEYRREFLIAGIPLIIIGLAWRFWASGFILKNQALTTGGPYLLSRHPLYFGSFLTGLGFSLICGKILFGLIFILFFLFAYLPLMKDEEKKLLGIFGDEYRNYMESVPMFFPTISTTRNDKVRFSFKRLLKNKEYRAWIGVSIFLLLLFLKFHIWGYQ